MNQKFKNRLISLVKDIYVADNVGLDFNLHLAKELGYTEREIKIAGLMLSSIPDWCIEIEEIVNVLYDFENKPGQTIVYYIKLIDTVVVIDRAALTCQFYDKKDLDQKVRQKTAAK
jgi:hypothetical protein